MKSSSNQAYLYAPVTDAEYADIVRLGKGRLPFPKGVYRLCTHEESDARTSFYIHRKLLIAQGIHYEDLPEEPRKLGGLRGWLRRTFGSNE